MTHVTNLATLLTLTRPLAVLDLETTGTNTEQDRIVQIAITIHYPAKDPVPWKVLVNPGVPIPAEATAVHHITDAMVKDAHTMKTMAPKLAKALSGLDFCGYNVTFDLRMLKAEMVRAGESWSYESAGIIDAYRIEQLLFPRSLSSMYEKYVGKKLSDAHDASVDVEATEEVLAGQLRAYDQLPRTVAELNTYCWPKAADAVDAQRKFMWRGGEACIAFGKHTGTPLRQMDKGYLQWMLNNEFPADTKRIIEDALSGAYPERKV